MPIRPVQQGPGSIELPRSRAPLVKANALLYVAFRTARSRQGGTISSTSACSSSRKAKTNCSCAEPARRLHLSRQLAATRPRFIGLGLSVPSADDLQGAGEGRRPSGRAGRRPGRRLRRAPRRPATASRSRPSWLRRESRPAAARAHSLQRPEPDGPGQRYAAPGARAAAGDEARSPRARDARLRQQRALVHGHARLHSLRRDVPA